MCRQGHRYYKSTDCPTCPTCEKERKPESGFMSALSAPARRAPENNGITSLEVLAHLSRKELLSFHGVGQASVPVLEDALKQNAQSLEK